MDQMVLKTQQWLNATYRGRTGFGSVTEDGKTGWDTVNGLIRALQIELGITATANNFGPGTQSRFTSRWPKGISKNNDSNNVHGIIQGALWCKGYPAEYGDITTKFTDNMASSVAALKKDIGLLDSSSTIDLELMMALLSMKQFRLLSDYGGKSAIRSIQQVINRNHKAYTGILPTDGLYGREMNTGLIQVLQKFEGFTPEQATGNFGDGTRSRLKTVNSGSGNLVWLASAALVCNGIGDSVTSSWNDALATRVRSFQRMYALPTTGAVDSTTWMSLLTSKGDPNRSCMACDTRFEITDEFAEYLKNNGYKIVGRYLTEPGQDGLKEDQYFKALRSGELARIVRHGLQYFPIFQEYSTKLAHFSIDNARRHAEEAQAAARRLGIPPTIIYFAVDYDATDPEVTSTILPYFKEVNKNLGGGYRVGIYASRNICSRVSKAGYAEASFVSDMSTGYSGNLGFPIPTNWAFDQFHEVKNLNGKWDLDRVAFSGKFGAVGSVNSGTDESEPIISCTPPPIPSFNHLASIATIIPLIQELESAAVNALPKDKDQTDVEKGKMVLSLVLSYLAIDYLKSVNFMGAASTVPPIDFEAYLKQHHGALVTKLDRFIGEKRVDFTDSNRRGKNDLAHMAYTLYCYYFESLSPDFWTGWGGDLASGMADLHALMSNHPTMKLQRAADALIGSDTSSVDDYLIQHGVNKNKLNVRCNFTDMCDDADAILISDMFKKNPPSNLHALSDALTSYYSNVITQNRYSAYAADGLDYSSRNALAYSIWRKMNGPDEYLPWLGLLHLAGESSQEERVACCFALAGYLLVRSR